MKKFKIALLIVAVAFTGAMFGSCDLSIYDLQKIDPSITGGGMDVRQFLDAKTCYGRLLDDLNFMMSNCYHEEKKAGAQAYTILLSYGLADLATDSAALPPEQFDTKVDLYDTIRRMNMNANNFADSFVNYDPAVVLQDTKDAIILCNRMINYF